MNWYAKFYSDIPNNEMTKILFQADSKYHNKNRYAVIDEDEEYYYIAMNPNDIECTEVCRFNKKDENKVYYLREE